MKKQAKRKLTPKQRKQRNIFFGVLFTALLILIVIKMRRKKADSSQITAEINSYGSSTSTVSSTPSVSSSGLPILGNTATLKKGTKSAEVRWVQWDFNQRIAKPNGWTLLAEDGIFGSKTEYAVNSVLKKKTTSWAEWKNKVDAIVANRK